MLVLDKGEVRLINSMGGDASVVAAARVSNGATYEDASKGEEADQKLINFLVKHRHGTPFEHATFQFYISAPLFVRSEWHRHRMASYNEISGRYVEYEPEFYIPELFRIPGTTNKQGSRTPVIGDDLRIKGRTVAYASYQEAGVDYWQQLIREYFEAASKAAYDKYKTLLECNVAKEMARMVLPANLYTKFYMTVNARGLMNFLSLRAAEDAQWEIRQYAIGMKEMFKDTMPLTYNAWEQNGFLSP